jgi:catalase
MWSYDPTDDPTDDCFRAGGDLYRIMTAEQKDALIDNTARNIAPCSENIKYRHAVHCLWADRDYGERITGAMGLDLNTVEELAKGDHKSLVKATLPGGKFRCEP